jgi:hypothetical protein
MKLFDNLYDKNVEITNIKYFSYISIEKNINLNNLLGCVSSIFNVLVYLILMKWTVKTHLSLNY